MRGRWLHTIAAQDQRAHELQRLGPKKCGACGRLIIVHAIKGGQTPPLTVRDLPEFHVWIAFFDELENVSLEGRRIFVCQNHKRFGPKREAFEKIVKPRQTIEQEVKEMGVAAVLTHEIHIVRSWLRHASRDLRAEVVNLYLQWLQPRTQQCAVPLINELAGVGE